MTTPAAPAGPTTRGTPLQRGRAALVATLGAVLAILPPAVVAGLADAAGELWYRLAPGRAAVARGNLAQIAGRLAAEGRGSARARAAAGDPDALERLVRAAFRHAARTYAETLRGAAVARDVRTRLVIETPEAVDAAFAAGGPVVFATPHFGSLAAVSAVLAERSSVPVTAPMETIADPELQRVLLRARAHRGARIIDLAASRRELPAALARGEGIGLVADRNIAGGGVPVPLFGLPARLPIGPAYLALEAGAPLHVAAARRSRGGYRGRLVTVAHPSPDLPRRARVEAVLAAEAAAFEEIIAAAPEQWWSVLFPIWEAVGPRPRHGSAARPAPLAAPPESPSGSPS